MAPAMGARVVRLVDRRRGVDWLVPAATSRARPARVDDSWVRYPRGGWDECLPSINPARINDRWCNDHGDLWSGDWHVTAADDALVCETLAPDDGYRFRRTLRLDGAVVQVEYELQVTGPAPVPYLWSMHPLIAPGTDVQTALPDGTTAVVGYCSDPRVQAGTILTWGAAIDELDGLVLGAAPAEPLALKLFARAPVDRPVTVTRERAFLAFHIDHPLTPYVGLWLNYGAWPPESEPDAHIAIEPTTAATDDLATAQHEGQARLLQPGSVDRWSVSLELGGG